MKIHQKALLLIVLGTAFLLRILFLLTALKKADIFYHDGETAVATSPSENEHFLKGGCELGDSQQYEKIALNLLSYKKFSWEGPPYFNPNSFRTPGYPVFIALIYGITIPKPIVVVIVQIFINLFTIFVIFSIGKKYWNQWVGFAGALLLAIDPATIFFCNELMAEIPYAFFLTIGACLLAFNTTSLKSFLSGILFGIGALLKPVGLYLPFVLSFFFLCLSNINPMKRIGRYLIFLGGFSIATLPWIWRNYIVFKKPAFTSISGYNALYDNAASLLANTEKISREEARKRLANEIQPQLIKEENPLILSSICRRYAFKKISLFPLRYLALHLLGGGLSLVSTKSDEVIYTITQIDTQNSFFFFDVFLKEGIFEGVKAVFKRKNITVIAALIELILILLCYGGIFYCFYRSDKLSGLLGVLFLIYIILIIGPIADSRFRTLFAPYIYLVGTGGIYDFVIFLKAKQKLRFPSNL